MKGQRDLYNNKFRLQNFNYRIIATQTVAAEMPINSIINFLVGVSDNFMTQKYAPLTGLYLYDFQIDL